MNLAMQMLERIIGQSGASEKVVERFTTPAAFSPDAAIPFTPLGERQRVQFERLRGRGAIVAEGARYYLDRRAFDAMRMRERLVRGAVAVAVVAAIAGAVVLS